MSKSGTEVKYLDYEKDIVRCNLCNKSMNFINYEQHYGECLKISALESIGKEKGFTRENLEEYPKETIYKLANKYFGGKNGN